MQKPAHHLDDHGRRVLTLRDVKLIGNETSTKLQASLYEAAS